MGNTEEPEKIMPNPRLEALKGALQTATTTKSITQERFAAIKSAMDEHAWVSTTADMFYRGVNAQKGVVENACQACADNVQAALDTCPPTITKRPTGLVRFE